MSASQHAEVCWQWKTRDGWETYFSTDHDELEKAFSSLSLSVGHSKKITTKFSFDRQVSYEMDFEEWTQKNLKTGKVRNVRRISCSSVWKGDSTIPDPCPVSKEVVIQQQALGAQSKRGSLPPYNFGPVSSNSHASNCFITMLSNEDRYCGDWAVFYHSYNNSALLYEIQAAIAAVLFRFKSNYGSLPRLFRGCFAEIPDAPTLMRLLPTWSERDHHPKFKSVGICTTVSLLAPDSEAPPTSVFLQGYSASTISSTLIADMLQICGVDAAQASSLTEKAMAIASSHGLHLSSFGRGPSPSGFPGHLLQIFVRRHLVDKYTYASLPMGVPDPARHPLSEYLLGDGAAGRAGGSPRAGQARMVVHPSAFLQAGKVRVNAFAADPTFHASRPAFQASLVALLEPILGQPASRERAARGIFGGELPAWFDASDQRLYAHGGGGGGTKQTSRRGGGGGRGGSSGKSGAGRP